MDTILSPDDVLDFWFGARRSPDYGTTRDAWFRKEPAFDSELRMRFGAGVDAALAGAFDSWRAPRPMLARVLLLDQFTRNAYRGTPRSFAGDALALALARRAIAAGTDMQLLPVERWFLYMPCEHAETMAAQDESVALFTRLAEETGVDEPLSWAKRHADVIRRFGRFPHRNEILGRASTPEEVDFLASPGSRF
ncbi:MAG: DUF924 family protein [Betaproteobacteria bacterium]